MVRFRCCDRRGDDLFFPSALRSVASPTEKAVAGNTSWAIPPSGAPGSALPTITAHSNLRPPAALWIQNPYCLLHFSERLPVKPPP